MGAVRHALRWTAVVLFVAGLVLGGLALVFPWSEGSFGFGDEMLEWGAIGGEIREEDESVEWSWYDSHIEDDERPLKDYDGVTMLRIVLPIYSLSLFLCVIAALIVMAGRGVAGGVLGVVSGVTGLVAAILIMVGISDFETELFAGFADQVMDTGAGQVLAFVATPLMLVAGGGAIASGVIVKPSTATPTAPGAAAEPPTDQSPPAGPTDFRLDRRHRFR